MVFFGWLIGEYVLAEKEANIYIFPSTVEFSGWDNSEGALAQDLSSSAELVDFTRENSSQVVFGAVPLMSSTTPKATDNISPTESSVVSPVSPDVNTTGGDITEPAPSSEPLVPEATSVPPSSTTESVTPEATTGNVTPSGESPATYIERALRDVYSFVLGAQLVVAEEIPVVGTTSTETGEPPPFPLIDTTINPVLENGDVSVPTLPAPTSSDAIATDGAPNAGTTSKTSVETRTDAYDVSSCVTLGKPCHVMEFAGFGLGSALAERGILGATVEISLAGRSGYGRDANDHLYVRAFHAGRWEFLGDLTLRGETSNGKRGGYLTYELPDFSRWDDLSDLRVMVEYDRTSAEDSTVYVDGLWVNVRYVDDAFDASAPETLALSGANVRSSLLARDAERRKALRDELELSTGQTIRFTHVDDHADAKLIVKSDRNVYSALGNVETYFNVTNESDAPQVVRLQFHFPGDTGRVESLEKYERNVPYRVGALTYNPVAYFCSGGWTPVIDENGMEVAGKNYSCGDSGEIRTCNELNEEKNNCIADGEQVGLKSDTEYRAAWVEAHLGSGSFHDEAGLFARAMQFIFAELPKDVIAPSMQPIAYTADSILIQPGATMYFRADVNVPLNARGDFYVEAAAESGSYGLVHAEWDGSWNYRIPITVDRLQDEHKGEIAVPIHLSSLGDEFWNTVLPDGADIRFVNETGETELPYWIQSWNYEKREGVAWVRLSPCLSQYNLCDDVPVSTTTPSRGIAARLYVYFGDQHATSRSEQFAPFRTSDLTPRAVVFGGSQLDMTIHAVALAENIIVAPEDGDRELLKKGESALFTDIKPGTIMMADGPVQFYVLSSDPHVTVVPFGFAGKDYVVPGIGGDHQIAFTLPTPGETHATLEHPNSTEDFTVTYGAIAEKTADLSESVPIEADRGVLATLSVPDAFSSVPLYPKTDETLYGFALGRTIAGTGENNTSFITQCSSGERQVSDGRLRGARVLLDHCIGGALDIADAVAIEKISHPISTLTELNEKLYQFLPKSEFGAEYTLPEDASSLGILCAVDDGEVHIGVFDPEGFMSATSTCVGRGRSPGKVFLRAQGDDFVRGSVVRTMGTTTQTFLVGATRGHASASPDAEGFSLLMSAPMMRVYSPNHPLTTIGTPEFVVPGEHRKLDRTETDTEKPHVNNFVSKNREFSIRTLPEFRFQYRPQSGTLRQKLRSAFDIAPFTVAQVHLKRDDGEIITPEYDIAYGDGNEWTIKLKDKGRHIQPGKYTMRIDIEEGSDIYTDEYDFYWGVLAINYQKSVFLPNDKVDISLAALSDNGNTLCDARLKLWITDPLGIETETAVTPSGFCNGNNVVEVPDYTASYMTLPSATGTYQVRFARFDADGNVAAQITDSFDVRDYVPLVVERVGPTRIYPLANYTMKLRVHANQDFSGLITEQVPGDFIFIDRGNANLEWGDEGHTYLTASWAVTMKAGDTVNFAYTFDAPDRSPYIYLLGPLVSRDDAGSAIFTEPRQWQIASDAVGKMIIFWDQNYVPSGWTCVSCKVGDEFYMKLAMGSSTYSAIGGGTATHTPTAVASVAVTGSAGVGPATTNNTTNAILGHSHTFTPTVSGVTNFPTYRELRVLMSQSAGDVSQLPAGAIVAFDVASSSLPSGWYRYSAQDGYYMYGASTTGRTAGANTHTHTVSGTLNATTDAGVRSNGASGNSATNAHTHTLSSTSTNPVNNEPPYIEVLLARLSATATPANDIITMWNDTAPSGWTTLSNPGGPFEGRFLKATSTYGGTGGSSSHAHVDISGATTSVPSASAPWGTNTNSQAISTHTHSVDISGFSTDSHLPPYVDVIFAKRQSGVMLWNQQDYRWYVNQNANTPTDPWPAGGRDNDENTPIDAQSTPVKPTDILRLRMSLSVTNSTSTVGSERFKLQYAESTSCSSALNWSDVGAIGSTTALWRGYDNTSVTNNTDLLTKVLTNSNVAESYVEQNNSTGTAVEVGIGNLGEWDWVIQDNLATENTTYCFRMALASGTPLSTYTNYPQLTTNVAPAAPTLATPFTNEKVGTTTPIFYFTSTDPEFNDIDYELVISSTTDFAVAIVDADSTVSPDLFFNFNNENNKAPFNSGDQIYYKTSALTNGSTYWWRVRAKDASGSNTWGDWSTAASFTVDTSVTITTWFQTTMSQFQTDTLTNVESTSTVTNDIAITSGQTSGTAWSPQIDFTQATSTVGTAWGSFSWNQNITRGTLKYQVEYLDATSTWVLIPDADLAGNSSGTTTSPISLLTLDPETYPSIRLRANFVDSGGTPKLLDWTVAWGYKVSTPVVSVLFDNAKTGTTTPYFDFYSTDPQNDDIYYEFQWSTTYTFAASTTRNSQANASAFVNTASTTDTNPFVSGNVVRFTIPQSDVLTNGTTYYYRVRAKDPNGANNFSFWSDIRSFTVDTSIVVSTWFQTQAAQFDTDTLTSMYTYAVGSTTVATSTGEAMIAYGEGTTQTPRYRIWSGSSWGAELSANTISATVQWVVLKASSIIGEYILGTMGSNRDVIFQVYSDGAWGNSLTLTGTAANAARRGMDVAYESLSGRAVAVACDGDADPSYAIWSSTSTSWSSIGSIDLLSTRSCEWVRLASNPISNEILLMERNTGNLYEAAVWNATSSTWGNLTNLGSMSETAHEGMALEYEESGYQALAIASNNTLSSFVQKEWRNGAWGATTTVTLGDDFEWGTLVRDKGSDRMALCYIDEDGDIGMKRWDGTQWAATNTVVEIETALTLSDNEGRPVDCVFEDTSGRDTYIMTSYSDLVGTRYQFWNNVAWSAEGSIMPALRNFTTQLRRTGDNTILGVWFDYVNLDYYVSSWNGTSWSATSTIETSASVTTSPYGEPFMIAPKNPSTIGTIKSTAINFSDGVAPAWSQVLWSATTPGASTFKVQVEYYNTASSSWAVIPDVDLPGNSTGTSSSPISIRNLNTTTYSQIRLVGNATCVLGNCPLLNDWTVTWAQGINVSGTLKKHDLSTNVTSGTVAIAVNGVIQTGKTGTVSGGQWSISNVTIFSGNTVEVFLTGAADVNEAVSVAKYTGSADLGGMAMYERWVTIGSASTTNQTVSLTDLGLYDYSASSNNEDIFFDVDAGGDFNNCAIGGAAACSDSSIFVVANNGFRPSTSTAKTINTYDMRIAGYLYADTNTIKVGNNWTNYGGFTANTSTITFNATSSTRSVDSTGAATSTFYNVTFGETGSTATWGFASSFVATGTVSMSYGTTSPGAQSMTLQGNLTIGASGTFVKGTATTTFSGSVAKTWTDSTASKQDLGNVLIDGSAKTVTLGSSVRATHIAIGADDTFNAGGANTITVLGSWENNGTFTAQTGTVAFSTTTTTIFINQGSSAFYNLTFTGVGGAWKWLNTNATTTNNLTITTGTVTLPGGTLAVGGTFDNTGGTFIHNSGVVRMTSTASGKNIRANGSSFSDLVFAGSGGGWTFLDTNATATQSVTIVAGTPVFPSGTLEVGNNFSNSGSFTANGGTVRMTSTLISRTITLGGSSLAGLFIANSGGAFTITDTNATATGDVIIAAGTLVFPSNVFTIGGSLTNAGTFTAGSGSTVFNASSGSKTINPGTSLFSKVTINGNGSFTVSQNATTTGYFILQNATAFTLSSGKTFEVGGAFTNLLGGAATTWTGGTLYLNSGTSYSINAKTTGGDLYDTLKLGPSTNIRAWNSSATTNDIATTASLYSQDNAAVDGDLYIYGAYTRTSGTDYWSYATDFDGVALGGSSRQVNVRFANLASSTFSNSSTLEIVGGATASTTIDRQGGSGIFSITLASSTLNAQYYQVRHMDAFGLNLTSSTTITSLSFGDFTLDTNGGSMLTVSSTTIDKNPTLQIFNVSFATSTGISSGYNVTSSGSPSSYWRFRQHYGNYDGEGYDNDPLGNPGAIRWDDSNFVISISGTVYADAGSSPLLLPTCNDSTSVVRVKVDGVGNYAAPCSSVDGTFTVSGVVFSGDTVMTIFLDTDGGAQAVHVTRSAVGDLAGIKLYQHRVIVSHEDVTPLTIADMNAYDGGDDSDIPFTATIGGTNTLTVNPETEFWIWTGKTFVPGGNITLNSGGSGAAYDGKFHIDNNAIFTAVGVESHSVGGSFVVDSGATFTAASSTFTFTATTTGKSIVGISALTFWNMTFSGVGGGWVLNQTTTVGNNLSVTAGTLSGTSNMTVNGTTASGAGVVAFTGGTFTFTNGGTFGGNTDWSFNNLTLGSGGSGTTAKSGSSTVSILGTLTVSSGHTLQAGSPSTWNILGNGTPVVFTGTLSAQTSRFLYSTTTATTIAPATYYQLALAPAGSGSPTFTLGSGTFTVTNAFTVGDGTNGVSVNANTNDPTMTMQGNMLIRTGATFVASNSGALNIYKDYTNQGTFTHSSGTISFVATTTGRTITPGNSSFGVVNVNSSSGGWTIAGNATSSGAFSLTALNDLTLSSGSTLEIDGTFTNSVGGVGTTWTNTTLYLNSGTSYDMNASTTGADFYETLRIGASTGVKMWNSSAASTTVHATGYLYSQDHAATDGLLYIYGAYTRTSGTDYWSYATDFDGTALGGGSSRQVNVRFATSASATISSSGGLEIIGASTASTSLATLSSGQTYALGITGGSTTMSYFTVRDTDTNGLNISGSPIVHNLSDGDFELGVNAGSMVTVAGTAIDANPLKTFFRNRFATSTGISSGFNVKATGSSASAWRFNLHYGNRAGEAYDSDPGGDPGYIIWDDSAAQLTISGTVYSDEGSTIMGGPTCNGVTQNVRLKVQGAGTYTSACDGSTGQFSISSVIYNPGDTLTLYLDTNGGTRAANIAYDPATNINNMNLYQNRVIVRHEQGTAIGIAQMDQYDSDQDTDIPFKATIGSPNTLRVEAGTALIVWTSKTFTPGGNVTMHANATSNHWDGEVHLMAGSQWSALGTESHTIGGQFWSESGASVSPANSTFTFTATTTGKSIAASTTLTFYNLTFAGTNGAWNIGGVGTTTNDLTISSGAVTLPSGTLNIGGSFDNSGGSFAHNGGTVRFVSTTAGKTLRAGTSKWNTLQFSGTGGAWTFQDTNATTTDSLVITAGTPTFPTGTLEVGNEFDTQGGAFVANGGTLRMTSTSTGRTVRLNGSSLAKFFVANAGTFTIADANATATDNVIFAAGTTTFPTANFEVAGSFTATQPGAFVSGAGVISFIPTSGTKTVNPGLSSFAGVNIRGGTYASTTMSATATSTGNFTLLSGGYTQSSGTQLTVLGAFSNTLINASTTWTGSTLYVNSGTTYAINAKTNNGDTYATLQLGNNTHLNMWNSSAGTYTVPSTASLYSQDHNSVDGALYIFGNYTRTSGTDYWSYATDFDGTALGGSSRAASVRFASGASASFDTGTTLQILGINGATTTIDRQSTGNYDVTLTSATINAQYYSFKNLAITGLALLGNTTITSMDRGDFQLDVTSGSLITIASTTIDQNASAQISYVRMASSTGIAGANVSRIGTTTNAITFIYEYGNLGSETYDNDGNDACGSIRFSDSSCLISDQSRYRFRNDDGAEGAPSSEWYDQTWPKRQRIRITDTSGVTHNNVQVKIQVPYDSDMLSAFEDIRFTDSSGTTSIPYWLESYTPSTIGTVWVNVPTLTASAVTDIFMYYGKGTAGSASSGTSTFIFFDDFEDGSLSEYSGNTTLFEQSTSFNYERTRGLDASAGNESTGKTTDGIGQISAGVGRDTTLRFYQYIDMTTGGGDEPCFLFAQQSPITGHQNYGVCLSPFGSDHLVIAKNVVNNGRNDGSTLLATKAVTYTTGWYETAIDWIASGNQINVTVYDNTGAVFATTTATDSSYTSGGIGFSYWGMHGGWDIPSARVYLSATPTAAFITEQTDSGATWKAAENTALVDQLSNENVRLRLLIKNSGTPLTDQNFRLQVASKDTSPNCESVPTENYSNVTTTSGGGCGSVPACMTTSAQFSDQASTTQSLTIPTGYTFAQGQILEDPSYQTGAVSLGNNQFTEVEYNFQMTSYAVGNAYCFRATKAGGVVLDNYSKVAELRMLHPPTISDWTFNNSSNIALTEGTTTRIYATGTVSDLNGYADIVSASSTYLRSSVSGSKFCTANSNNCYQIATSSCLFSSCSGNSCMVSCSAFLQYFADPTDAGSTYESDRWDATLDVWDQSLSHVYASSSQELYTLRALTTTSTIAYGSLLVGADTGATNATTSIANTGNAVMNLNLGGDYLRAGSSAIPYDKQKYSTTTFTYSVCTLCNILAASSTPAYYGVDLLKPTTTTSIYKNIFWGISIPDGTAATTHTGTVEFTAVQ